MNNNIGGEEGGKSWKSWNFAFGNVDPPPIFDTKMTSSDQNTHFFGFFDSELPIYRATFN